MKFSIGTKIGIGFTLALAALLAIGTVSHRNLNLLNEDSGWVIHTGEVLQKIENLSGSLTEAESSSRGFVITPDNSFEDGFTRAAHDLQTNVKDLRVLTSDNSTQQQALNRLETSATRRIEELQALLNSSKNGGDQAERAVMVTSGREHTDDIRQILAEMRTEEQRLMAERRKRSAAAVQTTSLTVIGGTIAAFALVALAGLAVTRSITGPLQLMNAGAEKLGAGDYSQRVAVKSNDEVGRLAVVFNRMAEQIQHRQTVMADADWQKSSLAKVAIICQGQRDLGALSQAILTELAPLLEARHSALYTPDNGELKLTASYACDRPVRRVKPGEGLIGQCFVQRTSIRLTDVPADYLKISSALGSAPPACIVVLPAVFDNQVKAVIELAAFKPFTDIQWVFLTQMAETLGIIFNSIEAARRTEELLDQSVALSADLRSRQQELSAKNDELEEQAARLRLSEHQLQEQQEEIKQANEELAQSNLELEQTNSTLQQTNVEMEERASLLAEQKREVERTNREVEKARDALREQARQLAQTSKYKSEFLANMSHELRTPLNSLLILSKILAENAARNLSDKQVQYANTIHSSGNDLLELINEILDLSKIEAGSVELELNEMSFSELGNFLEETFRHVAETRHLAFNVRLADSLPPVITTDVRRLEQVVKNLLSNAFKFTERGSVEIAVSRVTTGWDERCVKLNEARAVIAFAVTDTGIGIPAEKQQLIFEAFQQADAGTNRKYGGTGLGLSISREIARLLGGSLRVASTPGAGSTFTLYIPATFAGADAPAVESAPASDTTVVWKPAPAAIEETPPAAADIEMNAAADDRTNIQPGDLVLLIIEDDRRFSDLMVDFARDKKFKAVVARTAANGIALARQLKPAAITLDLRLPDNDGWVVLDRLKNDPQTRHIPVHIISVDEERERGLRLGAVSYLQKPVTKESLDGALNETIEFLNRPLKNLLVVEDDSVQRQSIVELIGNGDVKTTAVASATEALAALAAAHYDCLVLDLMLPDMSGAQLIREIQKRFGTHAPPVIVYTGKDLTRAEETELRMISETIIIKDARSPERLLDETALFLHRVQSQLPEVKRRMIEHVRRTDSVLSGRKILIVDDDVRNIFAVTSALESHQMRVLYAESGAEGLEILQKEPDIEAVLMDVMMPEMDGYEAIRRIRQIPRFKRLPVISVTAKAMKGDREKCLQAGASDYITKPVDMDQLRSLLRVWLYR